MESEVRGVEVVSHEESARRGGMISLAGLRREPVGAPQAMMTDLASVKPLTDDDLVRYWKEVAEELQLTELMSKGRPSLSDEGRTVEVESLTTWFNDDFKPHRMEVMERIRKKSGMPMLDCKVIPLFLEKDDVPYSPQEKYKAMWQQNPTLGELRKLFPQVDY